LPPIHYPFQSTDSSVPLEWISTAGLVAIDAPWWFAVIYVSGKNVAAGSGARFEDESGLEMKGVPELFTLWAVA